MTNTSNNLHDLAVLRVSGSEATPFLNGQLTVAVSEQSPRPRLCAWCDAKGRTIAIFRLFPNEAGNTWYLCYPKDLIDTVSKRLRMFILRSDVQVEDVSTQFACIQTAASDNVENSLLLGDEIHESLVERTNSLSNTACPLQLIKAGIPQIFAATSGLWVPQWLNLDLLDAIDFNKGCYPGQEVVAKLRFRGEVKRRLHRIQYPGTPAEPGAVITDEAGKNQGETVMSAALEKDDLCESLAVIRNSAIESKIYIDSNEATVC